MATKKLSEAEIIEKAIDRNFSSTATGERANVVEGLHTIAYALDRLTDAVERLGDTGADTPMCALRKVVEEGVERIIAAMNE